MYSSTSTGWRQRGLKRVLRSDLDQLIQRAFLPTCAGTIIYMNMYEYSSMQFLIFIAIVIIGIITIFLIVIQQFEMC